MAAFSDAGNWMSARVPFSRCLSQLVGPYASVQLNFTSSKQVPFTDFCDRAIPFLPEVYEEKTTSGIKSARLKGSQTFLGEGHACAPFLPADQTTRRRGWRQEISRL